MDKNIKEKSGQNMTDSVNSLDSTKESVSYNENTFNNTKENVNDNQVLDSDKNCIATENGNYIASFLPITKSELKLLIPHTVIFFLLTFIYSTWRNCKDAFFYNVKILTDSYDPAAAIQVSKIVSFLSTFVVLYLYTRFKNHLTRKKLFNTSLFIFLILLSIFLYNLKTIDHYYNLSLYEDIAKNTPRFKNIFAAITVWPIVIFYVFVELWGTFVLGIFFWMIIHVMYKKEETKRIYPLLMIGSAFGNIISGVFSTVFAKSSNGKQFMDFEKVLPITLLALVTIVLLYNYVEMYSIPRKQFEETEDKNKNKNNELGLWDSLLFILRNPYLLCIGGMLLGYNLYMGFLENIFKRMLATCDTTAGCIMTSGTALPIQAFGIGILSLALIFVSHLIKKYTQWKTKALSTPYLALLGVIIFSIPIIYSYITIKNPSSSSIYSVIVICGLFIIVPLKATKYVFFDPTKEQAYKIATEEEKTTGKMAIDSVCSRLAKALSSIIISVLNTLYFNKHTSAPQDLLWLFLSFCACAIFLISVKKLIPMYQSREKKLEA